jgi:hypothetical protein
MHTTKNKLEESKRNTFKVLLAKELERLEIALKIEKDRKIVFPETTQIVRDIIRIEEKLGQKHENVNLTIKKKNVSSEIENYGL